MKITELQTRVQVSNTKMQAPFLSSPQIMLAVTEEIGEVAEEVALLEKVGSKAIWQKEASVERLGEEISQALNCLISLANHYQINLEKVYNPES